MHIDSPYNEGQFASLIFGTNTPILELFTGGQMKTKSCFGYPWAKISQCQMPVPREMKKSWDGYWEKSGYWGKVCSNDPTKPGCNLYES